MSAASGSQQKSSSIATLSSFPPALTFMSVIAELGVSGATAVPAGAGLAQPASCTTAGPPRPAAGQPAPGQQPTSAGRSSLVVVACGGAAAVSSSQAGRATLLLAIRPPEAAGAKSNATARYQVWHWITVLRQLLLQRSISAMFYRCFPPCKTLKLGMVMNFSLSSHFLFA